MSSKSSSNGLPSMIAKRNCVPMIHPDRYSINLEEEEGKIAVSLATRIVLLGNLNKELVKTKAIIDQLRERFPKLKGGAVEQASAASNAQPSASKGKGKSSSSTATSSSSTKVSPVLYDYLAYHVSVVLRETFGYGLFVGDPNDKAVYTKARKILIGDYWIVYNLLADRLERFETLSEEDEKRNGVLMIVLSLIMYSNEQPDKLAKYEDVMDALVSALAKEGNEKERRDILAGHVDTLISQGYLTKKNIKDGEATISCLLFGPRSLVEIGMENVLEFMKNITGAEMSDEEMKRHFTLV